MQRHFKDAILNELAERANVAQFVSFDPHKNQRFVRIRGCAVNQGFSRPADALDALLSRSPEQRINIRSFHPDQPQGHEFVYGLRSIEKAIEAVDRLTSTGLYVIANETVDVNDGGVSGVVHGDAMEFAPGGTPRVVEAEGIVSVRRRVGERILEWVYGFRPRIEVAEGVRVEFSIHPVRRGYRSEHTIVWEMQECPTYACCPFLTWPNRFSEMLGDKAFGLLVAASLGVRVPRTTVLCRSLRPFTFGDATGADVVWVRTCPSIPEPGMFPTVRGWTDPFRLLEQVPDRERIASVLVQEEVPARYSGAALMSADGSVIIEGVAGFGDDLMLGRAQPVSLPTIVQEAVASTYSLVTEQIGTVRAEWVYDGAEVWLLQLQPESALSTGATIVPGTPEREIDFRVADGLSGLRELATLLRGKNIGIRLRGRVGVTSHIADVLRRERIPSRILPNGD